MSIMMVTMTMIFMMIFMMMIMALIMIMIIIMMTFLQDERSEPEIVNGRARPGEKESDMLFMVS